jgi:hypothetical protein
MKKTIVISILLLLFPCAAWAFMPIALSGQPVAAGGGCTEEQAALGTQAADVNVAKDAGWEYVTQEFAAGSYSGAITYIELYVKSAGTISGHTYNVSVCDNNSGDSGTVRESGNATCTISGGDVGGSYGYVGCTLTSATTLTNSTTYWIRVDRGGSQDSDNYLRWGRDADGGDGYNLERDDNNSGYTAVDGDNYQQFKLYSGACP